METRTFDDLETLSDAAAKEIAAIAEASVRARGRFWIALAGGNTPRRTYELLATRYRDAIDWPRTTVVYGDERFVPPNDVLSNHRMARAALLDHVPIPRDSIHAVSKTTPSADEAADLYDQTLSQLLGDSDISVDLALLGVGADGHTASLFPNSPALDERSRWAVSVLAPTHIQPAVPRVSTTLRFLDGARAVLFLVAGADKRRVIGEILSGSPDGQRYPAGMVAPRERTIWMIERSAMPDTRSNT
jgi:6-phosphogluconolactonase